MQKWDKTRRLVFCLLVSAAICAGAILCSCRRLADSQRQTQPRNLTPGLSEALTALARRHQNAGFFVFIVDRSGGSEEAKNLEALMAKAFEAGGWKVFKHEEKSAAPIHGLYCSYGVGGSQERAATELSAVLEQKGLSIDCRKRDNDPPEFKFRGGFPILSLEVGLNP